MCHLKTDAVRFALEVLQDIRSSIDTANIDLLLRQAELILEEIKARDFTDVRDNANGELSEADDCELAKFSHHILSVFISLSHSLSVCVCACDQQLFDFFHESFNGNHSNQLTN